MNSKKSILVCFILALPIMIFCQNSDKNLLYNGSFEEGPSVGSFITLKEGSTIPGWLVSRATVDLNRSMIKASHGERSIDMNGSPGIGAIEQTFFTDKGKWYKVNFDMAGNPGGPPTLKKMMVYAGEQSQLFEFSVEGKQYNNMGWESHEMIFKATHRKTTLRFESLIAYHPSNFGPVLDNVSVSRSNKKIKIPKTDNSQNISSDEKDLLSTNWGALAGTSFYFLGKDGNPTTISYNKSNYDLQATKANLGMHIGVYGQLNIGSVFLRPELQISSNRIEYLLKSNPDQDAIERYQLLDIPLLIGYNYRDFVFMLGPNTHILLGRQSTLEDLGDFTTTQTTISYGYEIGAGYKYNRFMLDLRFVGNMQAYGDGLKINLKRYHFTEIPINLSLNLSVNL